MQNPVPTDTSVYAIKEESLPKEAIIKELARKSISGVADEKRKLYLPFVKERLVKNRKQPAAVSSSTVPSSCNDNFLLYDQAIALFCRSSKPKLADEYSEKFGSVKKQMKAEEMALLIYKLYLILTRLDLDATIRLSRPITTQYAKLRDTY